jgi:hypothetical protein
MKTEMTRRETLLHEMFKAQAFEAPKRKPWSVSRPIVCQADMEEAQAALEMVRKDAASYRIGSLERQGAYMILAQIKARIAEREENSI